MRNRPDDTPSGGGNDCNGLASQKEGSSGVNSDSYHCREHHGGVLMSGIRMAGSKASMSRDEGKIQFQHGSMPKEGSYESISAQEPLLTAAQEVSLAKQILAVKGIGYNCCRDSLTTCELHSAAEQAKEKLLQGNIRLVVSVARKYAKVCDIDLDDLIQAGMLGLIKAIDKFDHARGFRFSTYATWLIRKAITRYIEDNGRLVRIPANVHEDVVRLRKCLRSRNTIPDKLSTSESSQSVKFLAKSLGWDPRRVETVAQVADYQILSLEDRPSPYCELSFAEMIPSQNESMESMLVRRDEIDLLRRELSRLRQRNREVLEKRFGLNGFEKQTLKEVAQYYGISLERVRQIQEESLRSLRKRQSVKILAFTE